MDDGDGDGQIEINLPQLPMSEKSEVVSVVLDEPYGTPSKLGMARSCLLTVTHDRGKFVV